MRTTKLLVVRLLLVSVALMLAGCPDDPTQDSDVAVPAGDVDVVDLDVIADGDLVDTIVPIDVPDVESEGHVDPPDEIEEPEIDVP